MSKVFLSTLGTGNYVPCHYVINNWNSELVVFVQEAIVDYLCPKWETNDRIVIFCTDEAKKLNWNDDPKRYDGRGLNTRLLQRGYPPEIQMISIPSGKTEDEIMDIFLKVIDVLNPGDEVFVDITHSFRSIPLLLTVVLNYAKVVKEVSVEGIFYGALEALGTLSEVQKMPEDNRLAPIFDLTPYDSLLEWAHAVNVFKKAGCAVDLIRLLNKNLGSLFRSKKEKSFRESLNLFSILKGRLESLTGSLATARGPEIWNFSPFSNLIEDIEHSDLIPPMKPLMEMIKSTLSGFDTTDPMERTFYAASWCIDHFMIPQAYILLREGIITGLCELFGYDPLDDEIREDFWGGLLKVTATGKPKEEWRGFLKEREEAAIKIINQGGEAFKELAKAFDRLRNYRNDFLHGGWKKNSTGYQTLMRAVKECKEELYEAWKKYVNHRKNFARKAFIIISHTLSDVQREELTLKWAVKEIVTMSPELKSIWENLSPSEDSILSALKPILNWLKTEAFPGDIVVVQGEYGATLYVAVEAQNLGLIPVYATTKRVLEETTLPDGSVRQERIFRHVRFRKFFP